MIGIVQVITRAKIPNITFLCVENGSGFLGSMLELFLRDSKLMKVFLIVIALGSWNPIAYPFDSKLECQSALENARIEIPNGAENERGAIMFCVQSLDTLVYSGTKWLKMEIK